MTIIEKHKGKMIKKVSNTGVSKEEYNALTNQVAELNGQVNNLNNSLTNKEKEINSGKQLIADAIDNETITNNSTFEAMSNSINQIKENSNKIESVTSDWYKLLKFAGYNVNETDSMEDLYNTLNSHSICMADVKQIACGEGSVFAVKNNGSLWVLGQNNYGQLGLGDTTNRTRFTQVTTNINNDVKEVICGGLHTFIIKEDGTIWSCGYNYSGQLGLNTSGTSANKTTFTQVTTNISDIKQISCGYEHSLILKNDGTVWGCGANTYYQLLDGTTTSRKVFTDTKLTDVKKISCVYTNSSTFVIKNDGSLWVGGWNTSYQLGIVTSQNYVEGPRQITTNINYDVQDVFPGEDHAFLLKTNNTVWATGNNYGQLGNGQSGSSYRKDRFTQMTSGTSDTKEIICCSGNTFIIKNDGTLWATGSNSYGQLGLGTSSSVSSFTKVTTNVSDIKQIALLEYSTFMLKNDGTLWATGRNASYQLGLGDNVDRSVFTAGKGFFIE